MENIVRKGEIACNKQFLLFSQCNLFTVIILAGTKYKWSVVLPLDSYFQYKLFPNDKS